MRNTFLLSFYFLVFGFWVPILFALLLNELKSGVFKKVRAAGKLSTPFYFECGRGGDGVVFY